MAPNNTHFKNHKHKIERRIRSNDSGDEDSARMKEYLLFSAVRSGKEENVIIDDIMKLANEGVDINVKNARGKTVLHVALEKRLDKVATYLIVEANAKIDIPDLSGVTQEQLLKSHSSQSIRNLLRNTLALERQFLNDIKISSTRVRSAQINMISNKLKSFDQHHNTPLMNYFLNHKETESPPLLYIEHGSVINYKNPITGFTALDLAWEGKKYLSFIALVEGGAEFKKYFNLYRSNNLPAIPANIKRIFKVRDELNKTLLTTNLSPANARTIISKKKTDINKQPSFIESMLIDSSVEVFSTFLELILSSSSEAIHDLKKQSRFYSYSDNEGDQLVSICAKKCNRNTLEDKITLLYNHGFDINYKNPLTSNRAVDIAFDNKDYNLVLHLLKLDSYPPKHINDLPQVNPHRESDTNPSTSTYHRKETKQELEEALDLLNSLTQDIYITGNNNNQREYGHLFRGNKDEKIIPVFIEGANAPTRQPQTMDRDILNFLSRRSKLHKHLDKDGDIDKIKIYISNNRSAFYFDKDGVSLFARAIEKKRYDLLDYLLSQGVFLHPEEKNAMHKLSSNERNSVDIIINNYVSSTPNCHIDFLVSKSRQRKIYSNDNQKSRESKIFKQRVRNYYEFLDSTPEISYILRAVQFIDEVDIIFHEDGFHEDLFGFFDPTQVRVNIGATHSENDIIVTLAHELTHCVIENVFNLESNPYKIDDRKNKDKFDSIVDSIFNHDRLPGSETFLTVKKDYHKKDYHSEFIARLIEVFANTENDARIQIPRSKERTALLEYYQEHVVPVINSFCQTKQYNFLRNTILRYDLYSNNMMSTEGLSFSAQLNLGLIYNMVNSLKPKLHDKYYGENCVIYRAKENDHLDKVNIHYLHDMRQLPRNYMVVKYGYASQFELVQSSISQVFMTNIVDTLVIIFDNYPIHKSDHLDNFFKSIGDSMRNKGNKLILLAKTQHVEKIKAAINNVKTIKYTETDQRGLQSKHSIVTINPDLALSERPKIFYKQKAIELPPSLVLEKSDERTPLSINNMEVVHISNSLSQTTDYLGINYKRSSDNEINILSLRNMLSDKNQICIISADLQGYLVNLQEILTPEIMQSLDINFLDSDIQELNGHVLVDISRFKEDDFNIICSSNQEKKINWIKFHGENSDHGRAKFTLEFIHDPTFYVQRDFHKSVPLDSLREMLGKADLNEIFVLENVNSRKDLFNSLSFSDNQKNNFKKNLDKGMIKVFNSRKIKKAESLSKKLSQEGKRLRYIEVKGTSFLEHIKEDDFTRRVKDEKVTIISGDAGIGKTTTLIHLYNYKLNNETPSISESHWGFMLNLGNNDHLQAIMNIDKMEVDIVADCLLNISPPKDGSRYITKSLLKESMKGNSPLSLLLIFDNFDEILDKKDREHVLSLIKFLRDSTQAKSWITTRTNFKLYLEEKLSTSSIQLDKLDPVSQERLIKKYFDNNSILFSNEVHNNNYNEKIEKYIARFLKRNRDLLGGDFLSNPLNLNLLLENSKKDFESWMQGSYIKLNDPSKNIYEVYNKFVDKKYEAYLDKIGVTSSNKRDAEKATFDKLFEKISVSIILNEKENFKYSQVEINKLLSIGLVQFDGKNVEFIHTSFREYFVSKVSTKWLEKAGDKFSNDKKLSYILEEVFTEPAYQMTRVFLNSLLGKTKIKNEALSSIGESIVSIYRSNKSDQKLLVNALIQEKEEQLVSLTLNSIKTLEKKDLYEIFSQKDKDGRNIIHYAADSEIPGIAIQIMNTMKENLSASEIQSLLMLQDKDGKIPFHHAASNQLTEVMVSMLNVIDKKEISTEEILNILMLQDKEGNTVLHYIPDQLDGTALSTMITFLSKERFSSKQIFKLFQLQNKNGETLLHIFADSQSGEMDESIYKIATFMKEKFNQEEIYSLLSKQNVNAETIFHYIAASELDLGIGQILELIEGNALSEENLYNLFSIKDNEDKIFLHHFSIFQSEETNWNIKRVLDVMEKKLTRDQIHKLYSEQDKFGKTFLHYLPDSTGISSENLSNILTFMFKNFSTQEVYNLVSIKSNENGYSVIHSFTDAEYYFERNKLFLDTLVEKLTKTQLYELLSIKDSLGQTALISNAAGIDILRKAKECGKMYDSLKIQDNEGKTVFHHISLDKVSPNILDVILENPDLDKISEILMLKDIEGKTFLYYIRDNKIAKDFTNFLDTLPQETIYKLASSLDENRRTFLYDFVNLESDGKDILAFFERKLDNKQIDDLLSTRDNTGQNILHIIGDHSTSIEIKSHHYTSPFSNKHLFHIVDDDNYLKEVLDPILNLLKKLSPSRIYSLLTTNSNKDITPINYAANNPTTSKPLSLILIAVKETLSLSQLYDLLTHKDKREFSLIDYIKNNDDLDTIDNVLEAIGDKKLLLSSMARDRGNQDLLDLLNSQPSIKRLKILEEYEESKDAIGLKPSASSCLPGSHRKRRSTCEENIGDLSQYNPLEEHTDQHTQSNSRLYSDIAYLFSIQASDPNKINTQNIIHYNKNIGDLINEREINHSKREKDILRNHYEEAKDFISSYPKETLLTSVNYKDIQERKPIIFDNGKTSVLVSYNSGHYEIYSKDYNYGVVFETNKGVSFNNVQRFVKAHFRLHSGISKYKLYKLSENLPPAYIDTLARFRFPDKVLSDLTLIEKGHLEKIDNIPAKIVRECFLLDEKVPEMETLHENFFNYYSGRITIRVEEMHNVISQLSKEESQELMNLIEKHNFPIDKNYLNTIPIENRILLENYHNKIHNRLNQLEPITIKELSDLSWKVLEESMSNHPDIPPELKESSLKTFKNIYDSVARKTSGTGTQILFFLPDVIRSVNTGNYNQLAALGGMIAGDAAFNHGYEKLISKLEPVLSKSRTSLLRKLPITSPIFKVLTIHSIYELHSELSTLPANSEKREIIKHKLGEQYFTAALMCAEMIGGIETGPLWIALMTEQLIYSGIAFRKENHLDISLTESIWMSLGFEQEKFQSLLKERKLLDINLSLVKTLSNQTNIDYDFAIVKVPKLIEIETKESEIAQKKHKEKWWSFIPFTSPSHETISNYLPLNTTIDFSFSKYTPKKYCMEDNVFLEMNNEYKRVSSTYTDDSNYCEEQPFPRILGDGLAALYAREKISNNSSTRNMISIFDPREGNLELKFTQQGMKKLDEYYGNNMTTPYYSIDVKVLYKPNPDKIQILKNTNKKFLLDDSSNRLISNYEINSTIPFRVNDNTHATSITLIGSKQSYINGSMSNFSIFSSNMHKTGGVLLTNKTHLNFNLLNENLVLDNLKIDVPSVNFLYRGRKIYNHPTYSSIRINSNVIRANISTTPSTSLMVFRNSGNEIAYNFRFLSYNESTSVMIQSLSSSYTSYSINYFKKEIQDIIYDICQFRNYYNPKVKSIQSYSNQGHFHLANITAGSLSIEGMVNDSYAKIQSGSESISFQIILDSHKHTEVTPFSSTNIQLDNKKLKLKKVATYTDYGSSYCHSDNRYLPLFPILEFYMSGEKVLYHLSPENSIFNVNGIDYKLSNNKIYVHTSSREIDGNKLIKLDDTRTVSILINRNLKNSTVSLQEKKMKINNITLNGIPDQTLILFENSGKKLIPISVKMIRNALGATRDKRSFGREFLMSDVIKINDYELSESKIIDSTENSANSTDLMILKNYDVNSTVLLLDLLVRKLTEEKYHNTPPHSLSELEARGYVLDIMEKFRMILEEAHKISECKTSLDYQEEFDLYLLVTKYVKSGQFYKVSDALYSTAQKICPERNEQFMINVRSGIEEITGHRIKKETQNNKSIKLIGLGTFLFFLSAFVCTKVVSYFTNRNTNESTRQENDQIPENENFVRSDTSVQAEGVHNERRATYSSVPYELSEIKSVLHKEENISSAV